jgi:predicted DNA-binding ribbon-helix-helix protein
MSTFMRKKAMPAITKTPTTEMEVTSIRLERELKNQLKAIAGNQGYQALIREVLWKFVQHKSGDMTSHLSPSDIRASFDATAQHEERCAITGKIIRPNEPMLLGLTVTGEMIPLSKESLAR